MEDEERQRKLQAGKAKVRFTSYLPHLYLSADVHLRISLSPEIYLSLLQIAVVYLRICRPSEIQPTAVITSLTSETHIYLMFTLIWPQFCHLPQKTTDICDFTHIWLIFTSYLPQFYPSFTSENNWHLWFHSQLPYIYLIFTSILHHCCYLHQRTIYICDWTHISLVYLNITLHLPHKIIDMI